MAPVVTSIQIDHTFGCLGFSFLRTPPMDGPNQRMTVLFLGDWDGMTRSVVTLPADALEGMR